MGGTVPRVEVTSYCRICAAACGIVVTVERDGAGHERVVSVRGDDAHPLSRGYTCPKGRGLAAWHHAPDRLDTPVVRGVTVSWDDALDDLAASLGALREEHGPDAVGVYVATGIAYDSAGQIALGGLLGTLGTGSFWSAATLDNAPVLLAAAMVTGNSAVAPVWDPAAAGLLLLVGTNPVVSHGYGTTFPDPVGHLRDFRRASEQGPGGRVWVLDPRRTESAAHADEHLALRPGSDVAVLAAVARELLADERCRARVEAGCASGDLARLDDALARWSIADAAVAAGVDEAALHALVDDVRAADGRVAVLCGTGTTMTRDGILIEWLRWVLLVLTGSLDAPGGMRFRAGPFGLPQRGRPWAATPDGPRSRPELPRLLGQLPAVAIADEIEAGRLRALVVLGGSPATACPDPERARRMLARLDALAVVDVAGGETVSLATHVLPATGQLERADVDLNAHLALAGGVRATRAVVAPGAERRPMWWILAALVHRLGGDLLGGAPLDLVDTEAFLGGALAAVGQDPATVWARGPHHVADDAPPGWLREQVLPDGRFALTHDVLLERLAGHRPPGDGLVLVPRREMAWSNSVRYAVPAAPGAPATVVHVHPDDLAAAGVRPGGCVRVTSAHGAIAAPAREDATLRPGTVALSHGRPEANASTLVSAREDVDPLSTMPRASGVPVTLTAVDASEELQ